MVIRAFFVLQLNTKKEPSKECRYTLHSERDIKTLKTLILFKITRKVIGLTCCPQPSSQCKYLMLLLQQKLRHKVS